MRSRGLRRSLAVAGILAMAVPGPLEAQRRLWQPEDRVLVSDGGTLFAVAAGPLQVFAAAPFGVLVYDVARRRWSAPIPLPIEMVATRASALAWDGASGTVWLGTDGGDLFTVAPGIGRWDRVSAVLRGAVEAIVAWPRDGAVYIRAGGEWNRSAGGSLFIDRVPSSTVPPGIVAAAGRFPTDPYFQAVRGTLGLDPGTRRWPLVAAVAGQEPGEFWIATGGGGLVRFDGRSQQREWIRYGLAGTGVGSIAWLGGTLWFGGDGRGARGGVASADAQLGEWRQYDRSDGAPGGFVAEIAADDGALWFGSSDGLFRLRGYSEDRARWSRLTSNDGLAADQVRSLAFAWGLLWAGTDRGLTAFQADGAAAGPIQFAGRRVSRLALAGDTLFIATDAGLWRLEARDAATALTHSPSPVTGNPTLRGRVTDVVATAEQTLAVVDGRLYSASGGPPTPIRDAALDRIGPALRLALESDRLWVAGPRGIAHRDPVSGVWEAFTVPEDIPAGPVADVRPVGDDVWAATPAGAVRLRWR